MSLKIERQLQDVEVIQGISAGPLKSRPSLHTLLSVQSSLEDISAKQKSKIASLISPLFGRISSAISYAWQRVTNAFTSFFRYFGFFSHKLSCSFSRHLNGESMREVSLSINDKRVEQFKLSIELIPEDKTVVLTRLNCSMDIAKKHLREVIGLIIKEYGAEKVGIRTLINAHFFASAFDNFIFPEEAVVVLTSEVHRDFIDRINSYFELHKSELTEPNALLAKNFKQKAKSNKNKSFAFSLNNFLHLLKTAGISSFHRNISVFSSETMQKGPLLVTPSFPKKNS